MEGETNKEGSQRRKTGHCDNFNKRKEGTNWNVSVDLLKKRARNFPLLAQYDGKDLRVLENEKRGLSLYSISQLLSSANYRIFFQKDINVSSEIRIQNKYWGNGQPEIIIDSALVGAIMFKSRLEIRHWIRKEEKKVLIHRPFLDSMIKILISILWLITYFVTTNLSDGLGFFSSPYTYIENQSTRVTRLKTY